MLEGFFFITMVKMPASLFSKQKSLLTSSELLGRGSNVIFGKTWLLLSQPFSTIGLFPQFGANLVKNTHTFDQRAMYSVVGIISRMLSAPPATGSLCQLCLKQINILLSEYTQRSLFSTFQRNSMSACSYLTGKPESISHNLGLLGRSNGHAQTMIQIGGICNTHRSLNYCRIFSRAIHVHAPRDKLSSCCAWSGATGFFFKHCPMLSIME